jgi:poly(A) polymerase/tRNA nucleotidyltransferase (CCA-adding enzyme)
VSAHLLRDPALAPILGALPHARLVGGCVRDMLAGRAIADIDLATPEPPDQVLAAIEAAGLRAVPTGLAHGTITAISAGRSIEITTLRRDVSTDGRHAEVAWTDDWRLDAARREFTINAMSLDQAGMLHDFFGGAADLAAGRVRFVGDAAVRIAEDFLRILRFFRFFARYGSGEPDEAAVRAIAGSTDGLGRLSPERIWSEIKRILSIPDPTRAVALMQQLGVLQTVLPEAKDLARLGSVIAAGVPPDPVLRVAALMGQGSGAAVEALAARLRVSTAESDRLLALLTGPVPPAGADDAMLRQLLADEPAPILAGRLTLAGGSATLRDHLLAMEPPTFALAGRDVLAMGLPAGPGVGEILAQVRQWWLDGGCVAGRDACLDKLRRFICAGSTASPGNQ